MPRCQSCDANLNDLEATRKHAETGEYLDLCDRCLKDILHIQDIPYVNNPANYGSDPIYDDMENDGYLEDYDCCVDEDLVK